MVLFPRPVLIIFLCNLVQLPLIYNAKLVNLPTHLKPLVRSDSFLIEFYDERFDQPLDKPLNQTSSSEARCRTQHVQFKKDLLRFNLKYKVRRSFCTLFNGVAIQLFGSTKQVDQLTDLLTIKAIWPMVTKRLPNFQLKEGDRANDPYFNHQLTKVLQTQKLGYLGQGVKVAIIDTGIDYTHPYLGSCFGTNCKVAYGKDLVGDSYDGFNAVQPSLDPMDRCNGHGTHVAGILAAFGPEFVGVAPNVTLGAYRVFGCSPDARVETDILMEAMELAYADGMDVINLSLGGDSNWPQYPDARVATRLTQLGVVVVAAAGNLGPQGLFAVASPAVADQVLSVASFDSDTFITRALQISGNLNSHLDYTIGPTTPALNLTDTPIVQAQASNAMGCAPHLGTEGLGKVLVVRRGNCTFDLKARHAEQAGAAALLVVNHLPGTFTPLLHRSHLPVIGMTALLGNLLLAQIHRKPNLRLSTPSTFLNPNGGRLSPFTAWGPSPTLKLKPELTGPGGLIFSTFPLAQGGYATLSGTSMAAPYLAGTVALYLEKLARGKVRVNRVDLVPQVRAALQNYAHPLTEPDGRLSPVLRQGAGRVDALAALTGLSRVYPSSLVQEGNGTQVELQFEVSNFSSDRTFSYKVQVLPAPTLKVNYGVLVASPQLDFASTTAITVLHPTGGSFSLSPNLKQKVVVQVHLSQSSQVGLVNGFIQIQTNQWDGSRLTLPYLIPTGNYRQLPVIQVEGDYSFPNLQPDRNRTSLLGEASITLHVKLYLPTSQLQVQVLQSQDGTVKDQDPVLGRLHKVNPTYLGRSSVDLDSSQTYQVVWDRFYFDPQLVRQRLVLGLYYLKVSAMRPFCTQLTNPSCWQTWNSKVIEVTDT